LASRIVITFRAPGGPGRTFLERARALEGRASARGGVLVTWDATRVAFAFDEDALGAAVGLSTTHGEDTSGSELPWCVGVAHGPLEALGADGALGSLAWGPAVVASAVLAASAPPGEIFVSEELRAIMPAELRTAGLRIGRDGPFRARGVRLDGPRPWRREALERLSRMRVAPLVGAPAQLVVAPGQLHLVRAAPGAGGTRALAELAARHLRVLWVAPSGAALEPLGALRRALARSLAPALPPSLQPLAREVKALLAGDGASRDVAVAILAAFFEDDDAARDSAAHPHGARPCLVVLDDARLIDPSTLEICAAVAVSGVRPVAVVARLEAHASVPAPLAELPLATTEIELGPLPRADAEALAAGSTSGALVPAARKRWARLGAHLPLAIVEALAAGVVSAELQWTDDVAAPRSPAAGRGRVRTAAEWILLRARDETPSCRVLLALIALLGGEAKVSRLSGVLEAVEHGMDVDTALADLVVARWLVDTQEDWVALPSRTHHGALADLLDDPTRIALHRAAADVVAREEGPFGRAEGAYHLAQAGDGPRAAALLLDTARLLLSSGLDVGATHLVAVARRLDPTCEEAAMDLLAGGLGDRAGESPGLDPDRVDTASTIAPLAIDTTDSEPPTIAQLDLAPLESDSIPTDEESPVSDATLISSAPGAEIAQRLAVLAKDALVGKDGGPLDRLVDGIRATGDAPALADRLGAISRLGRGDIGDALRVLRRTRSSLDPTEHTLRCQTSLALGVALSVAGRPQEALLEGMDALSRARRAGDDRGARACLAFLAKLYSSEGRPEAALLRDAAHPPP